MKMWLFAAAVALAPASTVFAQSPNDAQIASIVVTANQVDIDAGKLAESKTSTADVKAFAQQMVTDHTGVNKQAIELVTQAEGHARRQSDQPEPEVRRRRRTSPT